MKHIVYLTINKINFKIYIGIHSTENPNEWDYYLGCGVFANKPSSYNKAKTPFAAAVLKYGPSNFIRHTIKIFDTLQEAKDLESLLVDDAFIKNTNTYNITLGGGLPPVLNEKVYQYSLDGTFIKEWDSVKEIISFYNSYKDAIGNAIFEKRSFQESYWSKSKVERLNVEEYRHSFTGEIKQYNENGLYLNTFKSSKDASKKLDLDAKAIINAVHGRYKLHGYYFIHGWENLEDVLKQHNQTQTLTKNKIYQYDLEGNFIKEFASIADIRKAFPEINHKNVYRSIKTKGSTYGFRWSYIKVDNLLESDIDTSLKRPKKIEQYDINGNLIKVWDSISECKKQFPNLLRVIRGERNHCNGFKFKYVY